jgi:recombination associated protein RdgC
MFNSLKIKSVVAFKLVEPIDQEGLNAALKDKAFIPCGSSQMTSCGFEVDEATGDAVIEVNDMLLCSFVEETKNIPSSVVKLELQKYMKLNNIEKFKNKSEKEMATQDVYSRLIPRAFVKQRREFILIDNANERLFILNASVKRAEMVSVEIRKALGSLKIAHLVNSESVSVCLTDLVRNPENAPSELEIGSVCKAVEVDDPSASVKVNKILLNHEDIIETLGVRRVVELQAVYKESLVVMIKSNADFALSGLKVVGDNAESLSEYEDASDRMRAQVALTIGSVNELIDLLIKESE